jgi:hypothetical protein
MGNKLYVTQVPTPDFKIMHPDNTVICQVKISRAAMKAAQAKKQSTCKRKEKYFFSIISKSISCKTGAFYLAHFLDYFKLLLSEAQTLPPTGFVPLFISIFVCQKAVKRIFITIRAIYNLFTLENPYSTPQNL